jgi:type IV pilus assembly protein PilX
VVDAAGGVGTGDGTYYKSPMIYIHYLGAAPGGQGAVFQIDALGYGGGDSSIAVVESTFQVTNGVRNLGGL